MGFDQYHQPPHTVTGVTSLARSDAGSHMTGPHHT